jgi:hypothetical protein
MAVAASTDVARLRGALTGRVLLPDDPEYESARVVMRGDP